MTQDAIDNSRTHPSVTAVRLAPIRLYPSPTFRAADRAWGGHAVFDSRVMGCFPSRVSHNDFCVMDFTSLRFRRAVTGERQTDLRIPDVGLE